MSEFGRITDEMYATIDDLREQLRESRAALDAMTKERDDERHACIEQEFANDRLRDLLRETALQIDYLHSKFQLTGSGNAVLVRTKAALASEPAKEGLK